MYCANCGKELVDGANFCTACGSRSKVAERLAAATGAPAGEAGGVSAALASGRSRSRLRMSPLILLILTLALTAGIAAAAYYVYTEVYLPSVGQEELAAQIEQASDAAATEHANNHFATEFYEFDLPEYWRDRVTVVQDGVETTIYAKEGYDAGYEMQLAHISIGSGVGGGYGDITWTMILDEEIIPRIVIKVGASTPASMLIYYSEAQPAGSTGEITFLTAEAAAEILYPDVPRAILSDYIDLSTGGILSFEDLDGVDRQFVTANSCYAREALPPLITPNESPAIDAVAASLLGGWFISSDRTVDEYRHFENGIEYTYRPANGSAGSLSGYQLVSSRRLTSLERAEGRGDGPESDACWVANFDDGGTYWIYDSGRLSPSTTIEEYDHARSSVDERSSYYRIDRVDDNLTRLAETSEDRSE